MRLKFVLGVTAVIAVALGSVLGALAVRSNEEDAFERRQAEQALRASDQAEARADLAIAQLANAVAFFQTEDEVTAHEFDVFADSILENDALNSAALVEGVRAEERRRFERRRRLKIVEQDAGEGLRAAAPRKLHFPITQVAGATAERRTPRGYDLGSRPTRRRILLRARDSGEPAATRVVRLLIGGAGINVFHPIYGDGAPTATRAQRRRALRGFAAGSLRVGDLTQAATATLPDRIDVQLLEAGREVGGEPLPREEAATASVQIADRRWLLVLRDPARPGVTLPVLMAVLGLSLAALLGSLVLIWSRNEHMQELQRQASQDALTGLKNRRRFEEDLRTELARSRRERSEGALLMLDLDNFKQVNDTLGHPIGDRVIGEIAGVLQGRTRETDVLARLGGDEFAVVLPHCRPDEARAVAEEIATAIREHVPGKDGVPPITASIGVAMFGPGTADDLKAVEIRADAAMYEAKQSGRDAVRVAGAEPEASAAAGSGG